MRKVNRQDVGPPDYLSSLQAREARREFLAFLEMGDPEQLQTRVPDRHLPRNESLAAGLAKLFLGKCAFCESVALTTTYRFRPTSAAEPKDPADQMAHLRYGWLADAWQNLYPICSACRPRRMNYFPIRGKRSPRPPAHIYRHYVDSNGLWPGYPLGEGALLLDPCGNQDFREHLQPQMNGHLRALSTRGYETITHFRLDRPELVHSRAAAFAAYDARPDRAAGAEEPYSGLWQIYLAQLVFDAEQAGRDFDVVADVLPSEIATIALHNFKAIENLTLTVPPRRDPEDGLARALLILGENATGKSSILEAIALALLDEAGRQALMRTSPESAAQEHAPRLTDFMLQPAMMGADRLDPPGPTSVRIGMEDGSQRRLDIDGAGFHGARDKASQQVFAYGAYRHYLAGQHDWSPERPVISLFRTDNLLSNPDKWLMGLSKPDFDMVVRALREVFGGVEKFNVLTRDADGCKVVIYLPGGGEIRTPLSSVSSGFRTILALSCDVMRWAMTIGGSKSLVSATGIVLIDEVEAHLHPRWKVHIMTGLRRALPGMTFIVTTHDPLCLRGMRKGEVIVLNRVRGDDAGTRLPVRVTATVDLPDPARLTVEQLLTSDLFGLFSTEDARMEQDLAKLADYLAARPDPDSDDVRAATYLGLVGNLEKLREEIARELPIGLGEGGRAVQSAVATYLAARRGLPEDKRNDLRETTQRAIAQSLDRLQ